MKKSLHVLIGGGTGFIGHHLVQCFKSGRAKVKIITRNPKDKRPDHISWSQIKSNGLPKGTQAVVNLAGVNILDPMKRWNDTFKKEVHDSRIETNKILVDAIDKAKIDVNKPKCFVAVSGVAYYKPSATKEYDEQFNHNDLNNNSDPSDYLMKLAQQWEDSSKLSDEGSHCTRRVIIRSGVVLGKDGGIIQRLYLPYQLFLGGPIGSGKQWFPWIHIEDLVNMFKFAVENNHVEGVINGVAPQQISNLQFSRALAKAMNRTSFLPMPEFVVQALFGQERAVMMLQGQKVKTRSGSLGFRYKYPSIEEAVHQCV